MKQIPKRLTYANVVSSLALFLVLAGAGAVAATQLAKNSVGAKQLKKNAVTAAKIKDGAVTGAKIRDGDITGAKINLNTLGTVPSAARAASAARATTAAKADAATRADEALRAESAALADALEGQLKFSVRLSFGQQQTVASHGAVSIVAVCKKIVQDIAELSFQTSVNGAVAAGRNDYPGGPGKFLNVNTPIVEGTLLDQSVDPGQTFVSDEFQFGDEEDGGFVLGPEGKGLIAHPDGTILALNYGGPGCLFAGVVNTIG